jgi:hypothetical protein
LVDDPAGHLVIFEDRERVAILTDSRLTTEELAFSSAELLGEKIGLLPNNVVRGFRNASRGCSAAYARLSDRTGRIRARELWNPKSLCGFAHAAPEIFGIFVTPVTFHGKQFARRDLVLSRKLS